MQHFNWKICRQYIVQIILRGGVDMRKKVSKETVDLFLKEGIVSFYTKVAEEFSLDVTED